VSHLAVFYTNNSICPKLLAKSLSYFVKLGRIELPLHTIFVIVSCDSLLEWSNEAGFYNIIAPESIRNRGHLSIIYKIKLAMKLFPSDFVSLHEHDVLYPTTYLNSIQSVLNSIPIGAFDYVAYHNIIGVNQTGYLNRTTHDYPLSSLTFKSDSLKTLLEAKTEEYHHNQGWCYLEPGYKGSFGTTFKKIQFGLESEVPIVHVNMNDSKRNHHISNHFLTYERISSSGFNRWPGDVRYLFLD
jgi:hypothetical protein